MIAASSGGSFGVTVAGTRVRVGVSDGVFVAAGVNVAVAVAVSVGNGVCVAVLVCVGVNVLVGGRAVFVAVGGTAVLVAVGGIAVAVDCATAATVGALVGNGAAGAAQAFKTNDTFRTKIVTRI